MPTTFVVMPHPLATQPHARSENLRALCRALDAQGVAGVTRQAPAFGPSMTPDRLRGLLDGAPFPDYLARSVEHIMGVAMFWLDEPHADVTLAAGRLLVEHPSRVAPKRPVAPVPRLPDDTGQPVEV